LTFNSQRTNHAKGDDQFEVFLVFPLYNVNSTISDKTHIYVSFQIVSFAAYFTDLMIMIGAVPMHFLVSSSPYTNGYSYSETPVSNIPERCTIAKSTATVVVKENKEYRVDFTDAFKKTKPAKDFGLQLSINGGSGLIDKKCSILTSSIKMDIIDN